MKERKTNEAFELESTSNFKSNTEIAPPDTVIPRKRKVLLQYTIRGILFDVLENFIWILHL